MCLRDITLQYYLYPACTGSPCLVPYADILTPPYHHPFASIDQSNQLIYLSHQVLRPLVDGEGVN